MHLSDIAAHTLYTFCLYEIHILSVYIKIPVFRILFIRYYILRTDNPLPIFAGSVDHSPRLHAAAPQAAHPALGSQFLLCHLSPCSSSSSFFSSSSSSFALFTLYHAFLISNPLALLPRGSCRRPAGPRLCFRLSLGLAFLLWLQLRVCRVSLQKLRLHRRCHLLRSVLLLPV